MEVCLSSMFQGLLGNSAHIVLICTDTYKCLHETQMHKQLPCPLHFSNSPAYFPVSLSSVELEDPRSFSAAAAEKYFTVSDRISFSTCNLFRVLFSSSKFCCRTLTSLKKLATKKDSGFGGRSARPSGSSWSSLALMFFILTLSLMVARIRSATSLASSLASSELASCESSSSFMYSTSHSKTGFSLVTFLISKRSLPMLVTKMRPSCM
mmetsp:Transcript_4823/g.13179  ORF Transcript_4823/g.13179 Transcript_4823/m.13179 type:complete len:209 (+) Transcript_4823:294-920(+)